jgi:hypothetical protein
LLMQIPAICSPTSSIWSSQRDARSRFGRSRGPAD